MIDDSPVTDLDPAPHGCTINGQPAMPVLVAEYNQLVTELAELRAKVADLADLREELAEVQSLHQMQKRVARHRRGELDRAEAAVARVQALADRWVKAGPPLGVSMARWWDMRLAELNAALTPAADDARPTRQVHVTITNPDAYTANRSALSIADFLRAEFPFVHVTTDAHEWEQPGPAATEATEPAWTPPPPGDRREQLPDSMLALISDRMPDYVSTACQTADTLACAACYPGSGVPRPQYDEIREHAERLHNRCRINQKFTGQLCVCGCHA